MTWIERVTGRLRVACRLQPSSSGTPSGVHAACLLARGGPQQGGTWSAEGACRRLCLGSECQYAPDSGSHAQPGSDAWTHESPVLL